MLPSDNGWVKFLAWGSFEEQLIVITSASFLEEGKEETQLSGRPGRLNNVKSTVWRQYFHLTFVFFHFTAAIPWWDELEEDKRFLLDVAVITLAWSFMKLVSELEKKLKKFDLFAAVVWQDLNFRINKSYI